MTLTLNLTPEMEQYLLQKSGEQGLSPETYALQLLATVIPSPEHNTKLVNLLQKWIDEDDVTEQQETGTYLIQALDQDRLAHRPLFPPELQGISW